MPPTKGLAVWRATSAYDRAKIMRKAADLVRERAETIAKVMTQEQGKVFAEARAEVLAPPISSNGSPKKAAGPMAASCRAAARMSASW